MNKLILQLGGNRGDMIQNFNVAIQKIEERIGKVTLKSKLYETEPWGYDDVKWFLNQVIEVETKLTAFEVLEKTQLIEKEQGREVKKNDAMYEGRPLDIDIIFYNSEVIHSDDLMIPHPFLRYRLFVLKPLCDHWKDLVHPEYGVTVEDLLRRCDDIGLIRLYEGGQLQYPGMDIKVK
ncbi:MAG: 2-amino-4-hydroxy-6-hydroxymethyldihydropteridine diphosphokinase [Marinilabiliaceae bacterium]|nr:2-amino-4-hydroxy-6-hydroxymethyldihydropteridine diphosphokinase [Marinilabiliaceae bacterium]